MNQHEKYMQAALEEAEKARELNEVPVGAIIVKDGKIIAAGHNLREKTNQSLAHAELLAIAQANNVLNDWKLKGCTLYVTLEPCPMCAGAIIQARIDTVVFGARDPKGGSFGSVIDLSKIEGYNHTPEIIAGVLHEQCTELLQSFFKNQRRNHLRIHTIQDPEDFEGSLALRNTVFVQEQKVDISEEVDDYDRLERDDVVFVIAKQADKPLGTLRMVCHEKTIKIGRVAVLKQARGQKIGRKMMAFAEKYAFNNGYHELVLGAQNTAIDFYTALGYQAYGNEFMDAGILHVMMKKTIR